jgi:hypothetical protein
MANGKLRHPAEVFRDEMLMQDRICELLQENPLTIPELAQALDSPSCEVTAWVMAMRRYGLLRALPKSRAEDYYQYTVSTGE